MKVPPVVHLQTLFMSEGFHSRDVHITNPVPGTQGRFKTGQVVLDNSGTPV